MAGFIVLADGRAYAASNWAYDKTIEAIAEALKDIENGEQLRDWLLKQRVKVVGIGSVDVRELTLENQELLLEAIELAYQRQVETGPIGWEMPQYWSGWIKLFSDLMEMIRRVRKGEPAEDFNPHMRDVIPPRNKRSGPGW